MTSPMFSWVKGRGYPGPPTSFAPLRIRTYALEKPERLRPADTQDAAYFKSYSSEHLYIDHKRILALFCVADGASSAPYSGEWARHLTTSFCRDVFRHSRFIDWYNSARLRFEKPQASSEAKSHSPVKWYEHEFASTDPQCTIGGLILFKDRSWRFVSCGDTLFFHVSSSENKIHVYPAVSLSEMRKPPRLLSASIDLSKDEYATYDGQCAAGDKLIITTDCFGSVLLTLEERFGNGGLAELILNLFDRSHQSLVFQYVLSDHLDSSVRFFQSSGVIPSDDIMVQMVDIHA